MEKKERKPLLDQKKKSKTARKANKTKGSGSEKTSVPVASIPEAGKVGVLEEESTKEIISSGPEMASIQPSSCPEQLIETGSQPSNRKSYFGIRSYLHQFYETTMAQAQDEEDFHYLIKPKGGGKTFGSTLFKIGLITGTTLFLLGAVAIVIGYAIPAQQEVREANNEFKVVDRSAMRFNHNLDSCKLIGLAAFCSGGLVLVVSLLGPTFTSSYWDEDLPPEPFRVPVNLSPIPEDEPKSPIPVIEKIEGIQPNWTP